MSKRSGLIIFLSSVLLSGCSLVSLGPALQSTSADYATVFEEYNNQGILRNIMRASDEAPLSFADLPILHGSLSFNASLSGDTIGFGPLHGKGTTDTIGPGVSFTTSPTFDTNPLNTSGFSLNILQPISPSFVAAAWQAGFDKELLLRLFVESVEFTVCGRRVRIPNSITGEPLADDLPKDVEHCPVKRDDPTTFGTLIEYAIASGLDLRFSQFTCRWGSRASQAMQRL